MDIFILGFKAFFESIEIIKSNKTVRNLSFVPIFMSIVLLTLGLLVGVLYVDEVLSLAIGSIIVDLNVFIKNILYVFSVLIYMFVMYFVVFLIVSILSIPVAQKISAVIIANKKYAVKQKNTFSEQIKSIYKMLKASVAKIFIVALLSLIIFISTFVPILYPFALLFSFLIVVWDCMDYAFEADDLTLKQRIKFFKKYVGAFFSFSVCIGALLFIPFFQLLVLPVGVIGSTCLYINLARLEKRLS